MYPFPFDEASPIDMFLIAPPNASTDPVALDQACVDLVYKSTDLGKDHLIERIESRNGLLTIISAEQEGFLYY